MKRNPAYLAAAVVVLFWAADGRAQNYPDEYISGTRPSVHEPLSDHLPNSFVKLSADLPLNEFDLSDKLPKSFVRIAEELRFPDNQKISGHLPNDFVKLSTALPAPADTDDVAKLGLDQQVKISGRLPHSFDKISSQYPTPREN